jgi:hypothetical protein
MRRSKASNSFVKHCCALALLSACADGNTFGRDVGANTANPHFGEFFASYHRFFSGGFDIVF